VKLVLVIDAFAVRNIHWLCDEWRFSLALSMGGLAIEFGLHSCLNGNKRKR